MEICATILKLNIAKPKWQLQVYNIRALISIEEQCE